jgi:MFS family permease
MPDPTHAKRKPWLALQSKPYRTYSYGNIVSWTGDWLDIMTLNWAVLVMTDSPLYLALINGCRLVPIFLLGYPAGVLADRHDRRRLVFWLQFATMLLTAAVAGSVFYKSPFWIFALVVTLRSALSGMVLPIRTSLAANLVEPEAIPSAMAIQTAIMNTSRILGPALAGFLLARYSIATVFLVNAFSFLFVLYTLRQLGDKKLSYRPKKATGDAAVWPFIKKNPVIQGLLALSIVPMIFSFPYTTLMPLFVKNLLNLGPQELGTLLAVAGSGAFLGSLYLTIIKNEFLRPGLVLVLMVLTFGVGLVGFALSQSFFWSCISLFVVGLSSQIYRTTNRTLFQILVPDQLRGRILSIAMMDRGFIAVGTLILSLIAEHYSVWAASLTMGGGTIIVTLICLLLFPRLLAIGTTLASEPEGPKSMQTT